MKAFATGFLGKASPVHLFLGQLRHGCCATPAGVCRCIPGHAKLPTVGYARGVFPRGQRHRVVAIQRSARPACYAYVYPEPAGYRSAPLRPAGAYFDERLGEFLLPEDYLRGTRDPDGAIAEFFQSTYDAAADLGAWDHAALEPGTRPEIPPTRAWSSIV